MNGMIPHKRQQGLSLVELMVAMIISLFLLGGVIQVYTANKSTYRFSEAMSRIQESARYTLDTMARDLRMAGFWGCTPFDPSDTSNIQNNLDQTNASFNPQLHDFVTLPPISGSENNVNGSDSIRIRGAQPGQAGILPPYNTPTSAPITINQANFIRSGDIVMLSNCKGADIFQVSAVTNGGTSATITHLAGSGAPGNNNGTAGCAGITSNCLSQTYGGDAALFRLQSVLYYIANNANGEPALWRNFNGINQELVEGVEQLQLLYGIDTNGDGTPEQYTTSNLVADWRSVATVRLMLLLVSPQNVSLDSPQTYRFNGATITANDNRLRQPITTTVSLRNHNGN